MLRPAGPCSAHASEVGRERQIREVETAAANLQEWAKQHRALFTTPTAAEAEFVARSYCVTHFQQNIEQQKLLKGGRVADAFVIAKAAVDGDTVVTMELLKPNAVEIPNICRHFSVPALPDARGIHGSGGMGVLGTTRGRASQYRRTIFSSFSHSDPRHPVFATGGCAIVADEYGRADAIAADLAAASQGASPIAGRAG
jgi:Domain of unknown function (DUF4411)